MGDRIEETDDHEETMNLPAKKANSASEKSSQPLPAPNDQILKDSNGKREKKSKTPRGEENYSEPGQPIGAKSEGNVVPAPPALAPVETEKAQRRLEKAERKLLRQQKREARHQEKSQALAHHSAPVLAGQILPVESDAANEIAAPNTLRSGIHTVRQRQIRQKRMAMMDSKALKEVSRYSLTPLFSNLHLD